MCKFLRLLLRSKAKDAEVSKQDGLSQKTGTQMTDKMLPKIQDMTLDLWRSCEVDTDRLDEIAWAAKKIMDYYPRYEAVSKLCSVPAYITGCIHYREAIFDFRSHLANGDPLSDSDGRLLPTRHVPKNLGPFATWEEGAVAALKHNGLDKIESWDITSALRALERYNGLGYRKPEIAINSPYLWSFTNHYSIGKFTSDGTYSPQKRDAQVGCAAILKVLKSKGIDLNEPAIV